MKELNSVLFCVLNWGLGHASRSTPIIQFLISSGVKVDIASDGDALELLRLRFPELNFYTLPEYDIKYSKSAKTLPIKILNQLPHIVRTIEQEKSETATLAKNGSYNLIISDNRYGCFSKDIPSVIICHQLKINLPLGSSLINKINTDRLNKFDIIWVPDSNSVLSGKLSISTIKKIDIGWLSSYSKLTSQKDIDYLIALSGPEPQRSMLETKLLDIIPNDKKIVLVRGTSSTFNNTCAIEYYNIAPLKQMNQLLNRSKIVISRSGYSSLMDYMTLGLNAVLIPTPGQTEQEYLADEMSKFPQFLAVNQKRLSPQIFDWIPGGNKKQKSLNSNSEEAFSNALISAGFITPS